MSIFSKIKLFGSVNKEKPKDLRNIIETSDNTPRELSPEEKDMLNNVIGFGESRVEDCMVPRADIVAISALANFFDTSFAMDMRRSSSDGANLSFRLTRFLYL